MMELEQMIDMKTLYLKWKDESGNIYLLGRLTKIEELYYFFVNYTGLKNAIMHGCSGIGNFDLLKDKYINGKLFSFFRNRIPEENNPKIKKFLRKNNLKKYDPMEILKITKGIKATDRYYLDEKEEQ